MRGCNACKFKGYSSQPPKEMINDTVNHFHRAASGWSCDTWRETEISQSKMYVMLRMFCVNGSQTVFNDSFLPFVRALFTTLAKIHGNKISSHTVGQL